ncbi:MAG: hypothetical protein CL752_07575 [Chloroflexi bacterium]|nr:hypothetical protein [Chloroflexota bacterium]|tara:strand:- start:4172 stop:5011 length:840 start_codon:yes stop_codon:yes gene_type:complete
MVDQTDGITSLIPQSGWPRIGVIFLLVILCSWIVMGLIAARVSFDHDVLFDIFWSEILIVFWVVLTVMSLQISQSARDNPHRAPFAQYLPLLCAAVTLPGIVLLVVFLWLGFDDASQTLLRVTFSCLSLGLAGAYCSVIGIGRISNKWRPLRWVLYLVTLVAAIESLEALWLHGDISSETTLSEGFGPILVAFFVALLAYCIFAGILFSILRETASVNHVYVVLVYLVASMVGFTFGVIALSDQHDPGPFRLIMATTVLLATMTPLLVMFHLWPHQQKI